MPRLAPPKNQLNRALDTLLQRVTLSTVHALASLEEGHPGAALENLETAKPYDLSTDSNFTTLYYRGQALLESGHFHEATAEFHRLLDARLVNPNSPYLALAQLGLAEAARRAGENALARREFETFFGGWKSADPDMPILRKARSEYHLLGT